MWGCGFPLSLLLNSLLSPSERLDQQLPAHHAGRTEHGAPTLLHAPAKLLLPKYFSVILWWIIFNSLFLFEFNCADYTVCHHSSNKVQTHTHRSMHSITSDLILSRQTVPGPCKVCHRAINPLWKEHEWIRSKLLAAVLSEKSHTPTRKSLWRIRAR